MGSKFEVWTWDRIDDVPFGERTAYRYNQFWCGKSFFKAIWNLMKAKRTGSGGVKLEWR